MTLGRKGDFSKDLYITDVNLLITKARNYKLCVPCQAGILFF